MPNQDFTNIIWPRVRQDIDGDPQPATSDYLPNMDAWQLGSDMIFSRIQSTKRWPIFVLQKPYPKVNGYLVNAYLKAGKFDYACMCEIDRLLALDTPQRKGESFEHVRSQKWQSWSDYAYWRNFKCWYEHVHDGESFAVFMMQPLKWLSVTVWSWAIENDNWLADYEDAPNANTQVN